MEKIQKIYNALKPSAHYEHFEYESNTIYYKEKQSGDFGEDIEFKIYENANNIVVVDGVIHFGYLAGLVEPPDMKKVIAEINNITKQSFTYKETYSLEEWGDIYSSIYNNSEYINQFESWLHIQNNYYTFNINNKPLYDILINRKEVRDIYADGLLSFIYDSIENISEILSLLKED